MSETTDDTPATDAESADCTNAVVAIFVDESELVPTVGAVGVPVRAGDANGANDATTNAVVASEVELLPMEGVVAVAVVRCATAGVTDPITVPSSVPPVIATALGIKSASLPFV